MATTLAPRTGAGLGTMRRNPASAWRHVDGAIVFSTLAISLLGVLMVFSATRGSVEPYDMEFLKKQVLFVGIGVVVMAVCAIVDYRKLRDFTLPIFAGVMVLLAAVLTPLGSARKGTQAWFQLGPFQLQPSELSKLALILGLAALAASYKGEIDVTRLAALLGVAAVPFGLIMLQPDLGTAIVLVAIVMGVLLVAGVRVRHILALTLLGVSGVIAVLNSGNLEDYQRDRLTAFLDQEADLQASTYNLAQSKIAIGSGGLLGAGLFNGSQTKGDYVPEQHTDFIFTVVGEELGFVGSALLLILFAVLMWRTWRAAQLARDFYGTLVCVGVLSLLTFQVFQNVGMTMGIMPITGIPLPFMSYGGSSTLTDFACMGLVLNVHMRRFS
jgi:rod shape determining protein RodA